MKKIIILAILLLCTACTNSVSPADQATDPLTLPQRVTPLDTRMSTSEITTANIEQYLFLDDCFYIDTRDPNQIASEGMIAGFINIPYYDFIADFKFNENALFTMNKIKTDDKIINIGDIGSFSENFNESKEIIEQLFPKNENLLFISTAGVESTYLMNLLIQYGYDETKMYNVGNFSNSLGNQIAYREMEDARYLVNTIELYDAKVDYSWSSLTPKGDE